MRPALTLRCGTCLDDLCLLDAPPFVVLKTTSLSWREHLAKWTQYCQINHSTYPLNAAFTKWPSSQIICPSMQ